MITESAHAIRALNAAFLTDQLAMRQIFLDERTGHELVAAVWGVDLEGINWVTSLHYPARKIDFGSHRYVRFLNAHPEYRQTVIGPPIQSGYDDDWIVPVARNLYDGKDRRIGIIGASIHTAYFGDFYTRVTAGTNASVSLRTNDGLVLMRSPFDKRVLGQDVSKSKVSQRANSGPIEDALEDISALDGKRRLFAYRKTANFPVTTLYALDIESVLAPWRNRSVDRMLSTGVTILFIGILTFFLLLHIRRLRQSEDSLTASENRYRMLYEGAPDGILLLSRHHIYVDCNSAAVKLFGVPSKQHIIGKKAGAFSPPEQPQSRSSRTGRQHALEKVMAGEPQQFEWAILRNGELHHNEVTLSRVEMGNEQLMLCVFRDINTRKQAEKVQKDQNRILNMIAGEHDLQKILDEIVLFIERCAPHTQCMILLLSEDQSQLTWGAGPGIPETLKQGMSRIPVSAGNGASSEAVLSRYPVMIDDIGTHPLMHEMRGLFTTSGFLACGCWPIMGKHGQILGAFSMLYRERGIPSTEDAQLVGISTDLAGIAIESRWAEEKILHLAHYDELTGLPNRFLYVELLNKTLAQAECSQIPLAVLSLDLDRFKNINDTFGHEQGDAVLRDVSVNFRACLRESDTIARVGGDEFIVLVNDYSDPRHLGEIAQRLLVAAARPFEIDGQECQLSASIGIATFPVDGLNAQLLLKNADIAMYRAKTTGKNNYQFYSSEMNTHTVERLALETRLRRAIERREFVVHYQPKIDVRSGRIVGAEALVRWQHPEQGILFPGAFIGLAEEAGLIGPLGMLVLDIACCDINAFRQAGISFGRVAINLSGSQFDDTHLLDDVRQVIDSRQVDPTFLEFEITESMVMHNRDQAIRLMDGIRTLGFSLSIDDFGTGYSSLAYLKRFPVDSVKVDKSFINDIPQDPNDSAIVRAIIVMAHTLGLKVTAEGVETNTQLETLRKFGCGEYQGFHFSKAIPRDEFIALVQEKELIALA